MGVETALRRTASDDAIMDLEARSVQRLDERLRGDGRAERADDQRGHGESACQSSVQACRGERIKSCRKSRLISSPSPRCSNACLLWSGHV